MFLLRRTATRAIASAPSTALVKPRSFTTITPAFLSRQQRWTAPAFQRRFASDDASPKTGAEEAAVEAQESFAQTATEAPVEENLTPAQQAVQAEPTDAPATVGIDALDAAAQIPFKRLNQRENRGNETPQNVLYVGNLFYEVNGDQLHRVFSRFGDIESVRVVYDNQGMSRGFAYVEFKNIEHATAAVENLDMQVFEGRSMVVQYHKPKPNSMTANRNGPGYKPNPPSTTLFVGNMSFEMSDKDLNDLFRDVRNVMDVRVAIDRRTGMPRGFAHADFIDVASATRAKEALHGKEIYGRTLRVDFSKSSASNSRKPRDGATDGDAPN